jgi:hypothetical protein
VPQIKEYVRGHDGHGQNRQREKVRPTKLRYFGTQKGRTLPGTHQTETIGKIVHKQRKRTKEKSTWVDGAVPHRKKQNLGQM